MITSRSATAAPAGYRFPREVIALAVEELLVERGIEVDHVWTTGGVGGLHASVHRRCSPGAAFDRRPRVPR